ncbi:polyamine transporter 1 [Trichomonascus vanleenenianus]|uniref:MFS transporter n=1 Tax=Trichomonascus vanleenenianus TaxID=2268995 RepID=UPI003ECA2A4E
MSDLRKRESLVFDSPEKSTDSDSNSEENPQVIYDDPNSAAKRRSTALGNDEFTDLEGQTNALRRTATGASSQIEQSQHELDAIARVLTAPSSSGEKGPLPKMGGNKDYPPELPDRTPWRVEWDGPDDPTFPHNWPIKKKALVCFVLGYATLCIAWGSSSFAPAVPFISQEFHKAEVVAILGVSLYVFGFASGPIVWAPISELYGRKLPIVVSMIGFTLFTFAVATAKDFQTIVLCRFFTGFVGAAPLAVVPAAFADMFNNTHRGTALTIFGGTVFCGPIFAPVISGFIANSYLGWRWTMYITGIMGGLAIGLVVFFYEESYAPVILSQKAAELRRRTGNWGIYSTHDEVELDMNEIVTRNLTRPVVMLFTEPILFLITLYTAFLYGILYLLLEAYPIVFGELYKFKPDLVELPYIGLAIGLIIGAIVQMLVFEPMYTKALAANNYKPIPEKRLPGMIAGSIVFPIGIFWFTWSGNYAEHVHWIVPTLAGLFIGFGLLVIFQCAINYLVECYLTFAASCMAGNTFLRSSFGAAFPLFAGFMFHGMGTNWAGTLLGCFAVVLIPVPILFYIYGKRLRQMSRFAFDLG